MRPAFTALLCLIASTLISPAHAETRSAIFAGGCFWCVESDFEKLDGVLEVVSGYSGGHLDNPSYEQVSAGTSGHIEVARIDYDPSKISYRELLDFLWRHIDPTDSSGQFCDKGSQYRPAVFYGDDNEQQIAQQSLQNLKQTKPFKQPVTVELLPASTFYPAEDYHQDYYKKNPLRYKFYRYSCGRDARIETLWGDQ